MKYVVLDTETSGLNAYNHEVIQIAASMVDEQLNVVSSFECKLEFDLSKADRRALEVNSYDSELWSAHAVPQKQGLKAFISWMEPARVFPMVGASGRPWQAAVAVAYNLPFDDKMLRASCKRHDLFFPVAFKSLCLMQRALWEWRRPGEVKDHKLTTIADKLGVEKGEEHDAMGDVVTTINVLRALYPEGL